MTDQTAELLPCPFCRESELSFVEMTSYHSDETTKWWRVKCGTCGAQAPETVWNRRQSLPPSAESTPSDEGTPRTDVAMRHFDEIIRPLPPDASSTKYHGFFVNAVFVHAMEKELTAAKRELADLHKAHEQLSCELQMRCPAQWDIVTGEPIIGSPECPRLAERREGEG